MRETDHRTVQVVALHRRNEPFELRPAMEIAAVDGIANEPRLDALALVGGDQTSGFARPCAVGGAGLPQSEIACMVRHQ